jgi:dTDP-4-amino-4,6-dideoxygalactose transaminase
VNSRLDTLQAAILRVKLRHLDSYHTARQNVADWYDKVLSEIPEITIPERSDFSTHIFHQYTIKLSTEKRDSLKAYLMEKKVPSMIYYPVPLHLQQAYKDLGYKEGDMPVSEQLCHQVLSLPMHTEMDERQLKYITDQIETYFTS